MDMKTCETCGNYYDKAFVVQMPDGGRHVFDSFECAVSRLAPTCEHCGCRVIGHGVEHDEQIFCCESCARMTRRAHYTGDDVRTADEVEVTGAETFPASDPPGRY